MAASYVELSQWQKAKLTSLTARLQNAEERRDAAEAKARSHETGAALPRIAALQLESATEHSASIVADLRVKLIMETKISEKLAAEVAELKAPKDLVSLRLDTERKAHAGGEGLGTAPEGGEDLM